LALAIERQAVVGTYIRARFDTKREPPSYAESFKGLVGADRALALFQQLFASQVFRQTFQEEDDRGMRDVQAETWTFSRGDQNFQKTLFEPLPANLERLRQSCREIAEQLVQHGTRGENLKP
jgi:hypothetical protein